MNNNCVVYSYNLMTKLITVNIDPRDCEVEITILLLIKVLIIIVMLELGLCWIYLMSYMVLYYYAALRGLYHDLMRYG